MRVVDLAGLNPSGKSLRLGQHAVGFEQRRLQVGVRFTRMLLTQAVDLRDHPLGTPEKDSVHCIGQNLVTHPDRIVPELASSIMCLLA